MSYLYYDDESGQKVSNPFVGMVKNETKLKLKHKGKWHDYIVKNIVEDTKTHTCVYSAEDLFVNELSKNGFDVTLDREAENNIGTNKKLAETVLEGTDWTVDVVNSDINI
jgi:hypothetical protein